MKQLGKELEGLVETCVTSLASLEDRRTEASRGPAEEYTFTQPCAQARAPSLLRHTGAQKPNIKYEQRQSCTTGSGEMQVSRAERSTGRQCVHLAPATPQHISKHNRKART